MNTYTSPKAPHVHFESTTPRVPVTRLDIARSFYVERLGFALAWTWGDPPTHAGLCRDDVTLDLIAVAADRAALAMVYFRISGVDAYRTQLEARGVGVGGIADRPYGLRDFEVVDPFGNRLAFGEPVLKEEER